jgi:ketosteroid isomerase-like protein
MTAREIVVELLTRLYNDDHAAAADELMAPGLAERYRSHARRLRESSDDMRLEIVRVIDDDEGNVAVLYRRVGTHTGPMTGPFVSALAETGVVAATGASVDARGVWFATVRDGRIVSIEAVADNLTLFQQVGLVPGAPVGR